MQAHEPTYKAGSSGSDDKEFLGDENISYCSCAHGVNNGIESSEDADREQEKNEAQ